MTMFPTGSTGPGTGQPRGLDQSRAPRVGRWAWLPVLLVGLGLVVAVQRALALTQNPNLIPALLLLGALVIPVAFVVYLNGRNPAFDVPLITLLLCGLIGGVLGVVIAGLGEADALRDLGALPTLVIGLIEEAAKLIVPLAVLLFTRYRTTTANGLLIGACVGVGFAVLETMGYGFTTLLRSHGDLPYVETVLLIRGLASPAGHATWTGLAAAALWRAAHHHWRPLAAFAGVVPPRRRAPWTVGRAGPPWQPRSRDLQPGPVDPPGPPRCPHHRSTLGRQRRPEINTTVG